MLCVKEGATLQYGSGRNGRKKVGKWREGKEAESNGPGLQFPQHLNATKPVEWQS